MELDSSDIYVTIGEIDKINDKFAILEEKMEERFDALMSFLQSTGIIHSGIIPFGYMPSSTIHSGTIPLGYMQTHLSISTFNNLDETLYGSYKHG